MRQALAEEIKNFYLPQYNEIPGVGLFLEQVAKYINEILNILGEPELTGSMISNYVKKDIIDNPIKKQYGRDQIACLMFIAVAKTVLSLEDINIILKMQKENCEVEKAYNYFREAFPRILSEVFDNGKCIEEELIKKNSLTELANSVMITASHKIYLNKTFLSLKNL